VSRNPFELLSGGQQARFQLLLMEVDSPTMLLLDEPTDNLDVASADALQAAVDRYEGTVIAVTHDRWFMRTMDRFLFFDRTARCASCSSRRTRTSRRSDEASARRPARLTVLAVPACSGSDPAPANADPNSMGPTGSVTIPSATGPTSAVSDSADPGAAEPRRVDPAATGRARGRARDHPLRAPARGPAVDRLGRPGVLAPARRRPAADPARAADLAGPGRGRPAGEAGAAAARRGCRRGGARERARRGRALRPLQPGQDAARLPDAFARARRHAFARTSRKASNGSACTGSCWRPSC
jgi:hypothetical protein